MWIATSLKSCVLLNIDVKFGTLYSYLVISHRSLLRSKCKHGIICISGSICDRYIEASVYILEEKRFHYRGTTERCCNSQIGNMFSFEVYMYSKYNENSNWRFDDLFSNSLSRALVMYWQRRMRHDKNIMNCVMCNGSRQKELQPVVRYCSWHFPSRTEKSNEKQNSRSCTEYSNPRCLISSGSGENIVEMCCSLLFFWPLHDCL